MPDHIDSAGDAVSFPPSLRRCAVHALRSSAALLCVTAALLVLSGCGGYAIGGRVISGPVSMIAFVDPDDPQLTDAPVTSAQVAVIRDPDRPGQDPSAAVMSRQDGSFTIELSEFGAGWMEEKWEITAGKPGYRTATIRAALPKSPAGKRMLIVLSPGSNDADRTRTWEYDFERFR